MVGDKEAGDGRDQGVVANASGRLGIPSVGHKSERRAPNHVTDAMLSSALPRS